MTKPLCFRKEFFDQYETDEFDYFQTSRSTRKLRTRMSYLKGQSIIGYKKVLVDYDYNVRDYRCAIATLRIPVKTLRRQPCNGKCRASSARVLRIQIVDRDSLLQHDVKEAVSEHNRRFTYKVGQVVKPEEAFCKSNEECASGIHFFLTLKEAIDYIL